MRVVRLAESERPAKGTIIGLFRGYLDNRSQIDWFEADGKWIVPQTINDFWYGTIS